MSARHKDLSSSIVPVFKPKSGAVESSSTLAIITKLHLRKHPEGGYFNETDRDARRVANPFRSTTDSEQSDKNGYAGGYEDATRAASTTIYYLLTPVNPIGVFHRNKARTVHTLHQGRGRYVIIHADEVSEDEKARIETFIVGKNILADEKVQWLVEGGKYKASFLLPSTEGTRESEDLLISETVVPGFEFSDHDFLLADTLRKLVLTEQYSELDWLLSAKGK